MTGAMALFPGQGSQRPGMAGEWIRSFPAARRVFALADEVLRMPLSWVCTHGSAGDLLRTEVTQPAILTTSLAVHAVLLEEGFEPAAVAGHSLGEYTALVAAGVLPPEAAISLVRCRGELMAACADRREGVMTAVLGTPAGDVEAWCAEVPGVVAVANYNEPGQTVVSGEPGPVAELEARVAASGGRSRRLTVAGAFHSPLMAEAAVEFGSELDGHAFGPPRLPFVSSVTGDRVTDPTAIRRLVRDQLTAPVRWTAVLRSGVAAGYRPLVEVGPAAVLTALAKRTAPEVPRATVSTPDALPAVVGRAA